MTVRKVCDIPLPVKEGGAIECAASFFVENRRNDSTMKDKALYPEIVNVHGMVRKPSILTNYIGLFLN